MASNNKDSFAKCIATLAHKCSDASNVEVLIKIDIEHDIRYFEDILKDNHFIDHKVVFTPESGYTNLGKFQNQLSLMAKGEVIWLLTDDFFVKGDWVNLLEGTRNTYPDNIYAVFVDFGTRKWFSLAPAVSREWVQCLGYFTSGFQADYWIAHVARDIGRNIKIPISQMSISHERTTPKIHKKAVKALHAQLYNGRPESPLAMAVAKLLTCIKG